MWKWQITTAALGYWDRLGHVVAGQQYVADSSFAARSASRECVVADGVAFAEGHRPKSAEGIHDGQNIAVALEAVSDRGEDSRAAARFAMYASLGIPRFWVIRGDGEASDADGMVIMHELRDGEHEINGHRLVSRLT